MWKAIAVVIAIASPRASQAQQKRPAPAVQQASLTFAQLIFRLDEDKDEIGVAKHDFRIFILERLRSWGYRALGAENLVFGKDESSKADLVLGGTVREIECRRESDALESCRIGIEWQLLDVLQDEVVYSVLARAALHGLEDRQPASIGKELVLEALRAAVSRAGFREKLVRAADGDDAQHPAASFQRCERADIPMPTGASSVLDATVMVESGASHGSGFFISPDGLVLTAAHVVGQAGIRVRTRDGATHDAHVVRSSKGRDAALLYVPGLGKAPACLPFASQVPPIGSEVYAIGAPASRDLAFSMTRGIVSGTPELRGQRLLQTDASVSPGNSGGPLVDGQGRTVAVVTAKLAATAVEGVAFGMPVSLALSALALGPADVTEATLLAAAAPAPSAAPSVTDTPDPIPSLDPEGDRKRAEEAARRAEAGRKRAADAARRAQERRAQEYHDARVDAATPGYVKVMKWAGLGLAVGGGIGIAATYLGYDKDDSTRSEFEDRRLANDISWAVFGAGVGTWAVSLLLVPDVPREAPPPSDETQVSFGIAPGGVWLGVRH